MVQWPGVRILRRQELDAFLAQALSPKLYEPDQLQELKVILNCCNFRGLSSACPHCQFSGSCLVSIKCRTGGKNNLSILKDKISKFLFFKSNSIIGSRYK